MTQTDTRTGSGNAALNIAVFGAANLDISAGSQTAIVLGDSTPGHITTTAGGVGRNIAENLARLGHHVSLVSAMGNDVHGQFVLDYTRRAGVDVSTCSVLPGHSTGQYLSLYYPDGSMLAAINDMAVLDSLTPHHLAHHMARLAAVGAWVVDCNVSEVCLQWIMQNRNTTPVFADGVSSHKCLRLLPYLAQVHTLKLNRLEAQALTGTTVQSAAQAIAAAQSLCKRGVGNVVVSLGNGGVCWSTGGNHGHLAAIQVEVVSSNGAGDALMAGLVHGALAGWPLAQSVRFANACAALTVTGSGANHPELSEAGASRLLTGHRAGLIQP